MQYQTLKDMKYLVKNNGKVLITSDHLFAIQLARICYIDSGMDEETTHAYDMQGNIVDL